MNEIQFVQRLLEELQNSRHWPEIQSVISSTSDPALAANEMLVRPSSVPGGESVLLRVTVELLTTSGDAPAS